MRLRTPDLNDVPALADLTHHIWHTHYADIVPSVYLDQQYTYPQCHSDLATACQNAHTSPHTAMLTGAFTNNTLTGFVRMAAGNINNDEDDFFVINGFDAELEQLYIQPDARRQGVGKKLLENAAMWCQDHDKKSVCLWTFADNKPACDFYTAHGATVFQETSYVYVDRTVPLLILQWPDFTQAVLKP